MKDPETFDESSLRRSLGTLDVWKRIAFMMLCCERMLPNYDRFAADTGFGDVDALRQGIDAAWTWLESDRVDGDLVAIRTRIERQAPETEDFSSPYTSAALDAASAVASLLDAIEDPEKADPVEVAILARDTVDLYVQEMEGLDPSDQGFEDVVRCHRLMQAELKQQSVDLVELQEWSGSRRDASRQLRAKVRNGVIGSLATHST